MVSATGHKNHVQAIDVDTFCVQWNKTSGSWAIKKEENLGETVL